MGKYKKTIKKVITFMLLSALVITFSKPVYGYAENDSLTDAADSDTVDKATSPEEDTQTGEPNAQLPEKDSLAAKTDNQTEHEGDQTTKEGANGITPPLPHEFNNFK